MEKRSEALAEVRTSLARALGLVDRLIASSPQPEPETAASNYRRYPGGPLNEAGEAEITRRFEAGESDNTIALAMSISLVGVSKRRAMFRRARR